TDHALCIEEDRMNAPRVVRPVEGDFIIQVRVAGTFPPPGRSLVPTRRPFYGAGLLVWKDAKTYVRLERCEVRFEDDTMTCYANWESRVNGNFARMGGAGELDFKNESVWLRVERRGDALIGSVSPDGVRWTALEPMTIDLPRTVLVGVAAGQNTTVGYEPVFEHFRLFRAVEEK